MKTLSVCIPVYNTEAYLPRCLDSLLLPEAAEDLELLVVNDGSSDGSAAIARGYAERFPGAVRVIDKENGGHGSTINAALAAARGRYFRVLDSDDCVDPGAFAAFLRTLREAGEDLVVTPFREERSFDGSVIAHDYPWLEEGRVYTADELIADAEHPSFLMHACTFRTELLRESGLHLPEHCFYVDMQYVMTPLPFLRSFRYCAQPVYRYFIGRPEQSMAPEKLLRNLPMHRRVLDWMIRCYARYADSVPAGTKSAMEQLVRDTYWMHVELLCVRQKDSRLAYRSLRELEAQTRALSPELYRRLGASAYLRGCRRCRYLNLLLCRDGYARLLETLRRLRARERRKT
ncbi:MAG: glycosyltransferase [Oscillospiraceae bacterium]|nr:glycosyltransferase [Oscillospiraceae bacterium]